MPLVRPARLLLLLLLLLLARHWLRRRLAAARFLTSGGVGTTAITSTRLGTSASICRAVTTTLCRGSISQWRPLLRR